MSDVIWALDQRDRCIACPSKPAANAVVLHLAADGALAREEVARWAEAGLMTAGVAWPGATSELTADDWLDLEDAATGLEGLASVVAVVGTGGALTVAQELERRVGPFAYVGSDDHAAVRALLADVAPV